MLDVESLSEMMAGIISEEVAKAVAPLRAEIEELKARQPDFGPAVAIAVDHAIAALPVPQDGRSITADEVEPMLRQMVQEAVEALPRPKDGEPGKDAAGIVDALKDQGELVLTLQDGRLVRTGIRDGKDGDPGFGLDDFDVEAVDERTIKLMFTRGETCHSFELEFPVVVDRGVFKAGETYARGDAVSWGGSLWIAQKETDAKPDTADSGWRLAVKKGRDGKDAKHG